MNKEECKTRIKEVIKICKSKGLIIKLKNKYADIYSFIDQFKIQNQLISNSESIYWILNDLTQRPKCEAISPKCNMKDLKFNTIEKGYQKHCIKCCTLTLEYKEKYANTMIERYGVNHPQKITAIKEKTISNNLNKYGVRSTNQLQSVKDKKAETLHKHYGSSGLSNPLIKEKKIETNRSKYNTDWATQTEETQNIRKHTCIKNCGYDNWMKTDVARKQFKDMFSVAHNEEFLDYVKSITSIRNVELISEYMTAHAPVLLKCKTCSTEFQISTWNDFQQGSGLCPKCFPNTRSKQEIEVKDLINSFGLETICNSRSIISPYELDIYVPVKQIAIEYCGLWCHSSGGNISANMIKDKLYHVKKLELCNDQNIRLITIFEDEWLYKKEIVISKLKSIFGVLQKEKIRASKCIVKQITYQEKFDFINKYHIQGDRISQLNLGLFYKDELVSVMTFSKSGNSYDLLRFCSSDKYQVYGGASKLLQYFKYTTEWTSIFTYADRRWSKGNMYLKLGFKLISDGKIPNYWYWGKGIKGRAHRLNFTKNKISGNSKLTEFQIMSSLGYAWIYDCGNYKFLMTK
jgi:hypothetical protein